ncbi:interleukin-21 receptor [Periophthalmus magnuspinnatus]|uniref:interleukin-21 receptor n=1 Tax=Periophthalmus magnuspinnatus TaxID=409849 RepID=UPI00145A973C|nr:interleukin-21 receptor [Periophthalmus magnuspinnatus]
MKSKYILCPLDWQIDHFFCTAEILYGFVDTDVYSILFCYHDEADNCKLLDDEYIPSETIKPMSPCNFTMSQNFSQYSFSWKNSYEEYRDFTNLYQELRYQLRFYQKGQEFNGSAHNVIVDEKTYTIPDGILMPDSEYAAKVRSRPNQVHYKGHWSDWSTEIYWTTGEENNPLTIHLGRVLISYVMPVCIGVILVPFFLILCFIPVKKWKLKTFIPTPEPYFHTLYTDCHGDFKSWVVMEQIMELPKTEKIVHIDKMLESDICEAAPSPPQSTYANVSQSVAALLEEGLPYTVSTSGLDSATASCTSAYLSPQSRSPAEGDSGCWLSSDHSLERGPSWYCNDYCTLSTFQQSALGTSEPLKYGTHMMGFDEIKEIDIY